MSSEHAKRYFLQRKYIRTAKNQLLINQGRLHIRYCPQK